MRFILFLLFISSTVWSQTSYVPSTRLLRSKGYEIYAGGDYFRTSKTIPPEGKAVSLGKGESYQRTQFEVGGRYGLAPNFQVHLGGRFRQNQSTIVDPTTEEKFSGSTSGLQSIITQFSFGFKPVRNMSYSLEAFYRYVPYSYTPITDLTNFNNNDIILGDVGSEYGAGANATMAIGNDNFLTVRGGYRQPGEYLSSEVYWQAEAASAWKTFALVAGVDGVTSLGGGDKDRPLYNTGRTNLYHGFEREWIAPYLGVNVALGDTWRVELRGSQVVSGKSTDLGTAFGIQLIRRVEASRKKLLDNRFKSYDVEVTISKVSPKQGYVVVDKGMTSDIEKGMVFDFYEFDYMGGNVLVAQGTVIQTKSETAIVKITHHYKKEIKTGLVGRGQLK